MCPTAFCILSEHPADNVHVDATGTTFRTTTDEDGATITTITHTYFDPWRD